MTRELVVGASALLAIAWVPVAVYFWRSWRSRGAPLSLAITGLVGFPIYSNAMAWVFLRNDPLWTVGVLAGVNSLILANFYLCFRWQKARFPDARHNKMNGKKNRADSEDDTDPSITQPEG